METLSPATARLHSTKCQYPDHLLSSNVSLAASSHGFFSGKNCYKEENDKELMEKREVFGICRFLF